MNEIEWHYVKLQDFYPELNRALLKPHIQIAFQEATIAYWNVKRLHLILDSNLNYIPKPITSRAGDKIIKPIDADGCDWRWEVIGRPPRFHDYCCHSACHWLTVPNYLLAVELFPEVHWGVYTSERHTSVASLKDKLFFDLNYVALDVPAKSAADLIESSSTFEYITDGSQYTYWDGIAKPAAMIMNDIDNSTQDETQLITLVREAAHHIREEANNDSETNVSVESELAVGQFSSRCYS